MTRTYDDVISEILKRHFPSAAPNRIAQLAGSLSTRAIMGKASEYNLHRRKGKDASLQEIEGMQKQAIRLFKSLDADNIGTEARLMITKHLQLDQNTDGILPVMEILAKFISATTAAHQTISERDATTPERKRGRKEAMASRSFVKSLVWMYEELSGRNAALDTANGQAYGPFLDLVTELFAAVGIRASPERAIRDVLYPRKDETNPKKK